MWSPHLFELVLFPLSQALEEATDRWTAEKAMLEAEHKKKVHDITK
jgi:hypothetical protein